MTQNSSAFTLPVARAEGLYRNDLAATLATCCKPAAEAAPGDIVGLVYNFLLTRRGMLIGEPITTVLQIPTGQEGEAPRYVHFSDLPEASQVSVALACMKAQSAGISFVALEHHTDHLDPDDGEDIHFDLLLTPEFSILEVSDYDTNLYEGDFEGEDRTQYHIDKTFRVLLPNPVTSNHDLPNLAAKLEAFWKVVAPIYPIPGDDGENLDLGIGDLRSLIARGR